MSEKFPEELFQWIQLLTGQDSANRTIHRVLFGVKKHLDGECSVLILKNQDSDYLEVKNFINIHCSCAQGFHRPVGTGLIGRLFYTDEFVAISKSGPAKDYQELRLNWDYEQAFAARIVMDHQSIGFIVVYFNRPIAEDQYYRDFLLSAAGMIAEAIKKERLLFLVNHLRRIDEETGILSHDFFMHRLEAEAKKAERYDYPLSLAIMDIDNYKEIMLAHGASAGRQFYKDVAEELKFAVRGVDVIGLFGTDEFILYLPNTPLEGAKLVISRFRKKVMEKTFINKGVKTSLSIGLTGMKKKESLKDMVWRAQTALYQARLSHKGVVKIIEST